MGLKVINSILEFGTNWLRYQYVIYTTTFEISGDLSVFYLIGQIVLRNSSAIFEKSTDFYNMDLIKYIKYITRLINIYHEIFLACRLNT